MDPQIKANALEIIKNYRVPDLQALLDHARLPRQGNKRELFQRCKILISSNVTPQLINKIHQINLTRLNLTRSHHSSLPASLPSSYNQNSIALSPTPPIDILPLPNHIQHIHLPFFDKIRAIESINIPVDWNTFSPLRFILNDYDVDLILKNKAKVFLRVAPTIVPEKQNDVLPPYLFVQCNGQTVINNNVAKTVGSQAHSIAFPTDITDKLIPKSNVHNTLTCLWLQSPTNMSLKNLSKSYTLSIQLVHCVSLESLCDNILKREPQLTNLDNNDSDIEIEDVGLMATRHRVSLICPITQSLIVVPVKSSYCSHLTCFDLRPFLQMNERRLQWTCPLCKKQASYDTLRVDKRLQSILSNVPPNCSTVEIDSSTKILSDCQYILDNIKQEKSDLNDSGALHQNDDNDEESVHDSPIRSRRPSATSDCIVLSSGNESEDDDTQNENSPVPITPLSNDLLNQINDIVERQQSTTNGVHSIESILASNTDDGSYWEDIARLTYDFISDDNNNNTEQNQNRKRRNNSTSSLLSNTEDHSHRKRPKRSSNNIELITLSSSDSSDNDDQLS